jgi:hypothetical protein
LGTTRTTPVARRARRAGWHRPCVCHTSLGQKPRMGSPAASPSPVPSSPRAPRRRSDPRSNARRCGDHARPRSQRAARLLTEADGIPFPTRRPQAEAAGRSAVPIAGPGNSPSRSQSALGSAADGLGMPTRAFSTSRSVPGLGRATAHSRSGGQSRAPLVVPSGSLERHESAIVGYRIDAEAARRVPAV